MPIFNTAEAYLREAVSSILQQTFTDFEFLIVNDSPQNTKLNEIIESFNDNRIKYYINDRNLGIAGSRNLLLDKAQGEYIAIMDHDDVSLPERLMKQVEFLDNNPDIGAVGCSYQRIPDGKIKMMPANDIDIKCSLFTRCALLHPSTMIRKSILIENQIRYEIEYTPAEDYALWCNLVPFTRFANLPDILFHYRQHPGNTSKIQINKMKESTKKIAALYKENNKALWTAAQRNIKTTYNFKLFSWLPILSVSDYQNHRIYKLFRFIPIFWLKTKSLKEPLSFITAIPGCKMTVKKRYLKK